MSVLFNFPKDISKIPWRPVKFEMTGNSYECKAQDISFENGIRFIFNESLKQKISIRQKQNGNILLLQQVQLKYLTDGCTACNCFII
jgi:hypothetical protein